MKTDRLEILGILLQEGNITLEEFILLATPEVKVEYKTEYIEVPSWHITPTSPFVCNTNGEASQCYTPK